MAMHGDKSETYRSVWARLMTTPFKQAYVQAAGLRTRYIEAGEPDLPPLVLLHGTGGHWEAFCENIDVLSQHHRVFALDMLGCGFTDKPDRPYEIKDYVEHVVAFMDAMGLTRAAFIGVSLGSWVSTRLALAHPERVSRMILVAPTGYFPLAASVQGSLDARRNSADDPTWDKTRAVLSRLYHDPEKSLVDDIVAVRQRVYSLPGMQQIMPRMLTLFDAETRLRNNLSDDEWRSITAPVLLIEHVDTDDVYLKTARKVVDLLPNARLAPVKECSHWAQFENAPAFNPLALAFLAEEPVA
jgi:2-hydroxy-6-oxonona-2,4-dienedioate hydrolase